MHVIPIELYTLSQWAGCVIGLLLAVTVQGEAPPYFFTFSKPIAEAPKHVYDLNPAHHLEALVVPVFLLSGWGWSRKREVDVSTLGESHPFSILLPLSVPLANFVLVGVIGTFYTFLPYTVFQVAILVNIQMALANLLVPIPPLALGRMLCNLPNVRPYGAFLDRWGAIVLVLLLAMEHWSGYPLLRSWVFSITDSISPWILHR